MTSGVRLRAAGGAGAQAAQHAAEAAAEGARREADAVAASAQALSLQSEELKARLPMPACSQVDMLTDMYGTARAHSYARACVSTAALPRDSCNGRTKMS